MTRKDNFLRAIQAVRCRPPHDPQLAFRWALNINEKSIPPNIQLAARKFVARLCR